MVPIIITIMYDQNSEIMIKIIMITIMYDQNYDQNFKMKRVDKIEKKR